MWIGAKKTDVAAWLLLRLGADPKLCKDQKAALEALRKIKEANDE